MDLTKSIFFIFILISVSRTLEVGNLKQTPKLVLFDLDFVLWPYDVYQDVKTPVSFNKEFKVLIDNSGVFIRTYPEVSRVFEWLLKNRIPFGVLSTNMAVETSKKLIKSFGWLEYFKFVEIHPSGEAQALKKISQKMNIPYSNMLMFASDPLTHTKMETKNIMSINVPNGVDLQIFKKGIRKFSETRSSEKVPNGNSGS